MLYIQSLELKRKKGTSLKTLWEPVTSIWGLCQLVYVQGQQPGSSHGDLLTLIIASGLLIGNLASGGDTATLRVQS